MQPNTKHPQPITPGIALAISSYATKYPHLAALASRSIRGDRRAIVAIAQQANRLSMPDDVTLRQLHALYTLAHDISPNCL